VLGRVVGVGSAESTPRRVIRDTSQLHQPAKFAFCSGRILLVRAPYHPGHQYMFQSLVSTLPCVPSSCFTKQHSVALQQPGHPLHPQTFHPQTAVSLHLQVCFSLQLESVVLLDYLGPTPQPTAAAASQLSQLQSVGFHKYVQLLCREPGPHQDVLQG
jgi:hypothetical protein